MTISLFEAMKDQTQLEVVWSRGVLLSKIQEGDFEYELHQVGSFYVEFKNVSYLPGYNNMRVFENTDSLARYMASIRIPGQWLLIITQIP